MNFESFEYKLKTQLKVGDEWKNGKFRLVRYSTDVWVIESRLLAVQFDHFEDGIVAGMVAIYWKNSVIGAIEIDYL